MTICKYCGEDVPLEQLLPHVNSKHREESRKKPKAVTDPNVQKPVVAEKSETSSVQKTVLPETTTLSETTAPPSEDELTTIRTSGIFTYEITLLADAFTLFNLAKATGLEPNDSKAFDEWIWDCIRTRYSKEYKKFIGTIAL